MREEERELLLAARLISRASERRREEEERRKKLVEEAVRSMKMREEQALCPFCLGWTSDGLAVCGWLDFIGGECSGYALYRVDAKGMLFGLPLEERFFCRLRGFELPSQYELPSLAAYFREEKARRREIILRERGTPDAVLAKILPLRVSVARSGRRFKEEVARRLAEGEIEWANTLSFEELEELLPESYRL